MHILSCLLLSPADAVKSLQSSGAAPVPSGGPASAPDIGGKPTVKAVTAAGGVTQRAPQTGAETKLQTQAAQPELENFEQIIALLDQKNERILRADLVNNVHLVNFQLGKIEIRLAEGAATRPGGEESSTTYQRCALGRRCVVKFAVRNHISRSARQ